MKYQVEYSRTALTDLKKLDRQTASFILSYIEKYLVDCDNPRLFGKALAGDLKNIWRYRVGCYRILAKISDKKVTVTVVEVGHRSDIYQRK